MRLYRVSAAGVIVSSVIVLAVVTSIAYAAAISFTKRSITLSSFDFLIDSVPIDLDEDGDEDIVADSYHGKLAWFRNNGSQSFTQVNIDTTLSAPFELFVADMSGDDELDIVMSDYGAGRLYWFKNNGSESFTRFQIRSGLSGILGMTVADVDGDGDRDIVTGSREIDTIDWWQNSGTGSFTRFTIDAAFDFPYDVIAADFSGDGNTDIVAVGSSITWYKNDGSETFTKTQINSMTGFQAHPEDIDDDGDTDFVTGNGNTSTAHWWRNSGTGSFTKIVLDASISAANGIDVADADVDGDKDIVIIAQEGSAMYWYDNDGNETFTRRTVSSSWNYAYHVYFHDLDDDGDQDIVSSTYNSGELAWWEQPGSTGPDVSAYSPADGAYSVPVASNLVLTFDEAVRTGTGTITIKKSSGGTVIETITSNDTSKVSGSGTTQITINPDATPETNTGYYINISKNAFYDANHQGYTGITDATTWNFTTSDTIAPTINTLSPLDNATGINQTANLVIGFREIVQGGTGTIVIKKVSDDSTVESIAGNSGLVTGSGTTTITINPASTLTAYTDYYVTISPNAFRDRNRNNFAGFSNNTTWNFTTADLTNPTVSTFSPADNATGVSTTANLVITFSEVIQGGTGTVVVKKGSDNSVFETITANDTNYVSGSGTTQITINLSGALATNTAYYVIINKNAFQDAYGLDYAGYSSTTTWNFTTTATDSTKPLVVSFSPSDNATGVSNTTNLVVRFDEAVQGGTGTIVIKKGSDDSTVETITTNDTSKVAGSGSMQITINPAATLDSNTAYYVIINKNAFQDNRGNDYLGYSATTTWNFTTTDTIAPVLSNTGSTVTATGATITWTTDELASSRVQFGPTTTFGTGGGIFNTNPRVTSHTIILRRMFPCALYYYRVISADAAGNTTTGSTMRLTTPGCTGSANVKAQTGTLVSKTATGTLRLGTGTGIVLTVPPSATSNDATFQIKRLEAASVLATAGSPTGKNQIGPMFNLLAFSGTTTKISSFSKPLEVTLEYTEDDIDGMDESTLWAYRYDDTSWNALDDCTVDTSGNTVSCTTTAFSDFSIFGEEDDDGGSSGGTTGGSSGGSLGGGGGGGGGYRSTTLQGIASVINRIFGSDTGSGSVASESGYIFRDVVTRDWFGVFVQDLKEKGIVSGYRDSAGKNKEYFGPAQPVTYGEFAKMLLRLTHHANNIHEQSGAEWAEPYMKEAKMIGLSFYQQNRQAGDLITRAGVVHSVLEAYAISVSAKPVNAFTDLPATHPAARSLLVASSLGIMKGDDGAKTVRPDEPVNRAEVAKILSLVSDRFEPSEIAVIPIDLSTHAVSHTAAVSDMRTVATSELNLRADSRMDAAVRLILHRGTQVEVLGIAHDDWAYVRLANGKEGYVWRAHLTPTLPE